MLIPLGTDRGLNEPTRVTLALITINVFFYGWQVLGGGAEGGSVGGGGALDGLVLVPGESGWWTYVSYAFLHDPGGVLHILFNMLILWVFGPVVEDRLGKIGFLGFYLLGGVIAGVAHGLSGGGPVIGASGAVAAVTGAALALFPRARVRTLVIFFIIGVYMIPAWFFIGLAIARDIIPVMLGHASRVAFEAHLGGYAFGLSTCLGLLWLKVLPREPYDLFTISHQAKRRREFRAAVAGVEAKRRKKIAAVEPKKEDPESAAMAAKRAEVSTAIAEGKLDEAGDRYAELVESFGDREGAAVLNKRAQYTLAGHLYRAGRLALAAEAFGRYLMAFPTDEERGEIGLLLSRVQRALGRLHEAQGLLENAVLELGDPALKDVALGELEQVRAELSAKGA
ncbi:MAG: rhomboid family intramembrane serine protease [Planctomycetota bacterium]